MQHECKIAVLKTNCFADHQEKYLAGPKVQGGQNGSTWYSRF